MSLAVFLIAAVPAVGVAAVAFYTRRRSVTLLSAAAASALGLATGSPAYAALDVGAVALATLLVWPDLRAAAEQRREVRRAAKQAKNSERISNEEKSNRSAKLTLITFGLGLVGIFIGAIYLASIIAKTGTAGN